MVEMRHFLAEKEVLLVDREQRLAKLERSSEGEGGRLLGEIWRLLGPKRHPEGQESLRAEPGECLVEKIWNLAEDMTKWHLAEGEEVARLAEEAQRLVEELWRLEADVRRLTEIEQLAPEKEQRIAELERGRTELEQRLAKERHRMAEKETVLAEKEKRLEDLSCHVCFDGLKEIVFTGCGHAACQKCAAALVECHICRNFIGKWQKIRFYLT